MNSLIRPSAILLLALSLLPFLLTPPSAAQGPAAEQPPSVQEEETSPAEGVQTFSPEETDKLREKLGSEVIVEGTVVGTGVSNSGTVHYLNFSKNWRSSVSLVFFPKRSSSPISEETLQAYVGKRVRARGVLSEHNGVLQLVIHTLAQLETPDEPAAE